LSQSSQSLSDEIIAFSITIALNLELMMSSIVLAFKHKRMMNFRRRLTLWDADLAAVRWRTEMLVPGNVSVANIPTAHPANLAHKYYFVPSTRNTSWLMTHVQKSVRIIKQHITSSDFAWSIKNYF
jgi:hypothetical protein